MSALCHLVRCRTRPTYGAFSMHDLKPECMTAYRLRVRGTVHPGTHPLPSHGTTTGSYYSWHSCVSADVLYDRPCFNDYLGSVVAIIMCSTGLSPANSLFYRPNDSYPATAIQESVRKTCCPGLSAVYTTNTTRTPDSLRKLVGGLHTQ